MPTEMIKCDTCHKMVQRRNLKRHELLHSSSPKYSCKICDKEFTRAVHLNNHKKVHTSEKSFKVIITNFSLLYKSICNEILFDQNLIDTYKENLHKLIFMIIYVVRTLEV